MIKNILFDFGGIFMHIDREGPVAAFESLGVHDADELLDTYCQTGLFLLLESGRVSREEFVKRLNETYNISVTEQDIEQAVRRFITNVQEWKFDFLEEEIPSDVRVMLLSNTNNFIFPWVDEGTYLSNGRSVSSYFERTFLSYRMGVCKPEPEIFEKIIDESEIKPEETLFIDDGRRNIQVANELGFVTYLSENGEDWRPVLRKMLVR